MKKSDFNGWKDVYAFSFMQGLKTKSYIVFLIVFFLITLLSSPVMTLIKNNGESGKTEVERLLVYDISGLPVSYGSFSFTDAYEQVKVVPAGSSQQEYDAFVDALENTSTDVAVLIEFSDTADFELSFTKPAALEKGDVDGLIEQFTDLFFEAKLAAIDVTDEQFDFIARPVETECKRLDSNGTITNSDEDDGISLEQYYILLGGILVVTMIISFSGASISTSIITEKSTRVIEYLMINVRPMALLTGKILASLTLTLVQFAVTGLGFLGSKVIKSVLFGAKPESQTSLADMIAGFSPVNLAVALIAIITGVLLYCVLAGVTGASVSKMEEMQEGMKLYTFTMIIGAYLGISLCIMQLSGKVDPIVLNLCSMIPVATPFIVPINLLTGNIGLGVACAGIAIVTVCMALLFLFAARVYEALIFHTGKVLKLKDIIGIAKARNYSAQEGGTNR